MMGFIWVEGFNIVKGICWIFDQINKVGNNSNIKQNKCHYLKVCDDKTMKGNNNRSNHTQINGEICILYYLIAEVKEFGKDVENNEEIL